MKACSHSKRYTAIRAPKCNGGKVCDACRAKWQDATSVVLYGIRMDIKHLAESIDADARGVCLMTTSDVYKYGRALARLVLKRPS